jgi:hypothetical protein
LEQNLCHAVRGSRRHLFTRFQADDILDLIDAAHNAYHVQTLTGSRRKAKSLVSSSCIPASGGQGCHFLGQNQTTISSNLHGYQFHGKRADRVSREAIRRLFDEEKDPIS